MELLIYRGGVPVQCFIMLSGLVTHYAYSTRVHDTMTQKIRFYAKRFGAVILSYYTVIFLMLFLTHMQCGELVPGVSPCTDPGYKGFDLQQWLNVLWILLMSQSIAHPAWPFFLHGPSWTISTLAYLWLLYPFLQNRLCTLLKKRPRTVLVAAALWSQFQLVILWIAPWPLRGARWTITSNEEHTLEHHPLFRLGDFLVGMAIAQILLNGDMSPDWKGWRWLADGAFVSVWVLCSCVPHLNDASLYDRGGLEAIFAVGMQPFIGAVQTGHHGLSRRPTRSCHHGWGTQTRTSFQCCWRASRREI